MADAITIAIQSMQSTMQHMESISHNVANAATPGFKALVPVTQPFAETFQRLGAATVASVPRADSAVDLRAGALRPTGKALDVAIVGQGFFTLETADGPAYTRAGAFHLDGAGRLVSEGGLAVQGEAGDITLNGPVASIDGEGAVWQNGRVAGRIKTVVLEPGQAMFKTSDGLLRPAERNARLLAQRVQIRSGFLEQSNVEPVAQMATMMKIVRQYQSAQKVFQIYNDQIGNSITQLAQ